MRFILSTILWSGVVWNTLWAIEDTVGIHMGATSIHNKSKVELKNFSVGFTYQFNEFNEFGIRPRMDLDYVKVSDYDGVSSLWKGSLNGVYEIASDNIISPYLIAGIGYEHVGGSIDDTFEDLVFTQGGLGFRYHQSEDYSIHLESKVLRVHGGENQGNEVIVTAGVSVPLSKITHNTLDKKKECPKKIDEADADRDGIADVVDQCPNTPCYFHVDLYGCPIKATLKIHFDTAKANIRAYSVSKIERFAEYLIMNKGTTVKIIGHTDSDGTEASNLTLSEKRANRVKEKLVHLGVSPSRLTAEGKGESLPIASNTTASGKALNRRIEVELTYSK